MSIHLSQSFQEPIDDVSEDLLRIFSFSLQNQLMKVGNNLSQLTEMKGFLSGPGFPTSLLSLRGNIQKQSFVGEEGNKPSHGALSKQG